MCASRDIRSVNMATTQTYVVCLVSLFAVISVSLADDEHGSDAVSYSKDTFQSAIAEKKHFVMFFAPWCGHCKRLAPTWDELAKVYNNDDSPVTVGKVDCTVETALCADHDVSGYPTLKFFHQTSEEVQRFRGSRDLDSLKKFVEEQVSKKQEGGDEAAATEEGGEGAGDGPVDLTDDTFTGAIQQGFHFVKFFAPWCGHCKRLAPTWDELAKTFASNKAVGISKVDCTISRKICTEQGIKGYPTLMLFYNGDVLEKYQGSRSHNDLEDFIMSRIHTAASAQDQSVPGDSLEEAEETVVELSDENFDDVLAGGLTFVKFFAPWCGHCKALAPTWEELGAANEDKDVTIAKVDCTQHKDVCDKNKIRGYPTLVIFRNGEKVNDYNGPRDLSALQTFVDNHMDHTEL